MLRFGARVRPCQEAGRDGGAELSSNLCEALALGVGIAARGVVARGSHLSWRCLVLVGVASAVAQFRGRSLGGYMRMCSDRVTEADDGEHQVGILLIQPPSWACLFDCLPTHCDDARRDSPLAQ